MWTHNGLVTSELLWAHRVSVICHVYSRIGCCILLLLLFSATDQGSNNRQPMHSTVLIN